MIETVETILRYLVYLLLLFCAWYLLYLVLDKKVSIKRYNGHNVSQFKKNYDNIFFKHLESLLNVTLNRTSSFLLLSFLVVSSLLFILMFIFSLNIGESLITSIILSLIVGGLPYIILLFRLHLIRIQSSYEGVGLISELINQYKMNWFNIIEAIDQTIPYLKNEPNTRKALFRLALEIKQYKSNEELEYITQEFAFSINTQWGNLLADNIYQAISYRDNIHHGLEDILDELKQLQIVNEEDKKNNSESFLIIKYVAPGMYVGSLAVLFYYFNFNLEKYIEYQFKNPAGFQYFLLTISFIIINYFVYFLIRKPKNDF